MNAPRLRSTIALTIMVISYASSAFSQARNNFGGYLGPSQQQQNALLIQQAEEYSAQQRAREEAQAQQLREQAREEKEAADARMRKLNDTYKRTEPQKGYRTDYGNDPLHPPVDHPSGIDSSNTGLVPDPNSTDPTEIEYNKADQAISDIAASEEDIKNREREKSKQEWEQIRREAMAVINGIETDTPVLRKESQTMDSVKALLDDVTDKSNQYYQRSGLGTDPSELYVDDYPLPPDAKWDTASDWWRNRVQNGDSPNQLYLVEPDAAQKYDEDGMPISPTTPNAPRTLPSTPRYEKLSPMERRRLWWLPDSEDQLYLVE